MTTTVQILDSLFNGLECAVTTNDLSEIDENEESRISKPSISLQEPESSLKHVLMTLHFLFPHELLPALDLLDRKLVKCLRKFSSSAGHDSHDQSILFEVFYVQSASAMTDHSSRKVTVPNSRFRNAWNPTKTYYEVRLDSWSCTCAAFAHSLMGTILEGGNDVEQSAVESAGTDSVHRAEKPWHFGGTTTLAIGSSPICKHVLAAVLGKVAPTLFSDATEVLEGSGETLAGWAGGWNEG